MTATYRVECAYCGVVFDQDIVLFNLQDEVMCDQCVAEQETVQFAKDHPEWRP